MTLSRYVRCETCVFWGADPDLPTLIPGFRACANGQAAPGTLLVAIHRPAAREIISVPIQTAPQFACSAWEPHIERLSYAVRHAHTLEDAAPVLTPRPEELP
jgi:hypothetical protein